MTAFLIPQDDPHQALRVRRSLLAMAMAVIHLLMCVAMYHQGLFRFSLFGFISFSSLLWIGHISIFTLIRTGLNKRFADPSLTFLQIVWTATCIMATVYFLNALRPVALMLFLVGMLFGFLRLNFRQFIYLSLYAVVLYGAVIMVLCKFHPLVIQLDKELIVWSSFSLVTLCFALMGRQVNDMREALRTQNLKLQEEIGERKKAQEEVHCQKAYFEGLVDNMPDAIATFDENGIITEINSQFTTMFGYTTADAFGQNISDLVGPLDRLEEAHAYRRRITSGETIDVETVRKGKDDTLVEVSLRSAPVIVDRVRIGFLVIYRDISPRKKAEREKARLESQLQHAQKMEAIATLAGGVAHEFNNALMGIIGNLELLEMDLPEDTEMKKSIDTMKHSGHRMSRLTDQLLAYARGGKYQPKALKLNDFVLQILPIVRHKLKPAVKIKTHFQENTSYVEGDYTQLQMVLSAILANANEAVEDNGTIRISVKNEDVDEAYAEAYPGLKPGSYVCLAVADDGKGMEAETRDGIFEPFFTTKFQGRGMGMAAVYGIVKNHDGFIYVDSEVGKGTVVRIYFPVVPIEVKRTEITEIQAPKGSRTILIIEDEDMVLDAMRAMLERLGYQVFTAKTGKSALHLAETLESRVDLALLDIKLPDMEGGNLYPLLMEARPTLKVIVFSGYAIDGPAQEILDMGADGFIQKPFSFTQLSKKIKAVLAGR